MRAKLSFMAINRLLEEGMAENDDLQEAIERQGSAMLCDGRELSDAQLVARLVGWGISIDREGFAQMARPFLSAQEMSESVMKSVNSRFDRKGCDADWLWIALTCLWERWLPDRPSFEMIDDQMQQGYCALDEDDDEEACRVWLKVWRSVRSIIDEQQMAGLDEFDARYAGTQSAFNWLSDFEMALGNAGRTDPEFAHDRISVCRTFIERFSDVDALLTQNFKRALAESLRQVGDAAAADALYTQWLRGDPQWGWGWIGWSDDHYLFVPEGQADSDRAVELLQQGLSVPAVRDRADMLDRLIDLCEDLGRTEEAKAAEIEQRGLDKRRAPLSRRSDEHSFGSDVRVDFTEPTLLSTETNGYEDDDLPREAHSTRRVGRNEPCPCGSGKKYKKCCMQQIP